MIFTFDEPRKLTDHFDVPVDKTSWTKQYEGKNLVTPKRNKPNFRLDQALKQRSDLQIPDAGLFLLALEIPHKAIFIGFSESYSKNSNIIHRMSRYRIVITASNVGSVHHTTKLQKFAEKRFDEFQKLNKHDNCLDVSFMIGKIDVENMYDQEDERYKHIRRCIKNNSNHLFDDICYFFWHTVPSNVEFLNDRFDFKKSFKTKVLFTRSLNFKV